MLNKKQKTALDVAINEGKLETAAVLAELSGVDLPDEETLKEQASKSKSTGIRRVDWVSMID